jgi:aldose sugar dehydrogenase
MIKRLLVFVTLGLCASLTQSVYAQSTSHQSSQYKFNAVTFASGLENVWGMDFLPSGDMLVTERPGRLRIIRNGILLKDSVPGIPEVNARGQGGLLDVALHPNFATNHLIYFSYSKPGEEGATTAVARGKFENDAVLGLEDIFVANTKGGGHYGSRLAFDNDGYLFVTVGDRQASPTGDLEAHPAQDISNHHGTVNRIHDDGSIPTDNPFVGQDGAEPSIWSFGHRNPQGLTIDRATGNIWATEHGPQGGDELNLIKKGANYGWPVIGEGVNYGGDVIHATTRREGMEPPIHYWVPSIATAGALFYSGDRFPKWKGNIFVGGMVGQQVARLTMDGQNVTSEETLFSNEGRIRNIRQGPDGYIYLGIDGAANKAGIIRLEPANPNN